MLGIRLTADIERRLSQLCAVTGHTKSFYAKKALVTFLNDYEDYLIGRAALERQEPTVSLNALEKALGLGD